MTDKNADRKKSDADGEHGPDWLERTATIVSGAIVLGLLSLLLWDAFHADADPALLAQVTGSRAVGTHHYVSVSVRNAGDVAVRDVDVAVDLVSPDSTDHATFQVDWVPGKSVRHGVVILPRPLSAGKVNAAVTGYLEP